MSDFEKVKSKLATYKQEHLLRFWDHLDSDQKEKLLKQINALNLAYINGCIQECLESLQRETRCNDDDMQPVPDSVLGRVSQIEPDILKEYRKEGLKKISEGKVGLLLLAGGQGTRLGVSYPKGMYNVGLPSNKTLYQLMGERLWRLQELAAEVNGGKPAIIPWYIMTSESTRQQTEEFFEQHNFFGLDRQNIIYFEQGYMPCVDFDGKILMDSTSSIARAPDGNGGLYSSLRRNRIIEDFRRRGVECLHAYCVDNILVKVADPTFIGFCTSKNAGCGVKVVEKTDSTEPVGVICKYKNKYHVMEYSEISTKASEMRVSDGSNRLVYNAGGIANHFFTVDFLENVISQDDKLHHHVAKKKIPHVDEAGNFVSPKTPNGIKMEKFIFDVFQFTNDFAVWEVIRSDEFSPLKNADSAGVDCPTTCRESVFQLHRKWIEAAGGKLISCNQSSLSNQEDDNEARKSEPQKAGNLICEVSPLASYEGENLEDYVKGKELTAPLLINPKTETAMKLHN
ncbi:hypothetical protein HELRODRAFT_184865 [Helobdella robusta]|uniref:UDP-N-acetylglucosamine diphosphorylase n=1 Tax=Helobdella robusta TaxID=6412 RepID=T1FM35_HELRO|nr:hypothetical protein HELRODRAFT_184865 [Helobdella robusta]ESO13042.1 hypothetical protein HELRODRAFT_184865 [Helobdella robusta]